VRVIRVAGEEPPLIYLRRAREPLFDDAGRLLENPPSLSRVLTNVSVGGVRQPAAPELAARAAAAAGEVFAAALEGEAAFRRELLAPAVEPYLPLASCDFLLGPGDSLHFLEFHLTPTWGGIPAEFGADRILGALADHVAERFKQSSLKRIFLSAAKATIGEPLAAALKARGVALVE